MGSLLAQPGADSFYGEPSEGIFPHIPVEETNPRVRFQPPPAPPLPAAALTKGGGTLKAEPRRPTRGAVGSHGRPAGTKQTGGDKEQRGARRVPPGQLHPDVGPAPGSRLPARRFLRVWGKNQTAAPPAVTLTAPLPRVRAPRLGGQSAADAPPAAALNLNTGCRLRAGARGPPPLTAPAPPGAARRCGSDRRTKGRAGAGERRRRYRGGGTL